MLFSTTKHKFELFTAAEGLPTLSWGVDEYTQTQTFMNKTMHGSTGLALRLKRYWILILELGMTHIYSNRETQILLLNWLLAWGYLVLPERFGFRQFEWNLRLDAAALGLL
jgi:hypothetical protein